MQKENKNKNRKCKFQRSETETPSKRGSYIDARKRSKFRNPKRFHSLFFRMVPSDLIFFPQVLIRTDTFYNFHEYY